MTIIPLLHGTFHAFVCTSFKLISCLPALISVATLMLKRLERGFAYMLSIGEYFFPMKQIFPLFSLTIFSITAKFPSFSNMQASLELLQFKVNASFLYILNCPAHDCVSLVSGPWKC